ncbi:hypothetical protein V500_00758 [Pseudogymnoascus sp. VKM F-4518 (FW-2643)]|nr:hypothetical protein V500_00758 [Pseudogymnoascus sp. VKM F-4518 (FW-2643)]
MAYCADSDSNGPSEKDYLHCEVPLTPQTSAESSNPVTEILQLLQHRRTGTGANEEPWIEVKLNPSQYNALISAIEQDEALRSYFEEQVKYDYNPTTCKFAVRMLSRCHEVFLGAVTDEIGFQFRQMSLEAKDAEERSFLRKIKFMGSADVPLISPGQESAGKGKRCPDAQFGPQGTNFPGVIIEVAYSHKNLPELAKDYIVRSRGRTRAMIGFDIAYGKANNKNATMSKWVDQWYTRANGLRGVREVFEVDHQIFRNKDGTAIDCSTAGLKINLSEFAAGIDIPAGLLGKEIFIPAATLAEYLGDAEISKAGELVWTERELEAGST